MTTILNKEKILEQARLYIDEGKFDKAIAEYEKILVADPNDLRVKLRVAELYTRRKQVTEAIRIYREVAEAYSMEGFYLKAVTVLKNVLRLNPSLVDVNLMLAELYERMGLINDAVRQYDILATTLEHKGESARALETRRKIVDLSPTSEAARIRYAEMLQREGQTEEALDQYEEIARTYEKEGRQDSKLADMYEKILTHRDNMEMLRALCRIYDRLGEKKKVLKCIDSAKNIAAFDPELVEMQARIFAELNQIETARSKYLALAELHKEENNIAAATKAYAEIIILIPGEEERVLKRAEELGKEAVGELKKMVAKRRDEETQKARLEEERSQKEEEEKEKREQARKKEEAKKREALRQAAKGKAQAVIKEEEPPATPPPAAKIKEEEFIPPEAAKPAPVKPATPAKPAPADLREADAALHLGQLYLRMDLQEEAKGELTKAKEIYEGLLKTGHPEERKIKENLDEIKNLLSVKKAAPQPPAPAEKEKKKEEKEEARKKETEPEKAPPKTDKKKISFV